MPRVLALSFASSAALHAQLECPWDSDEDGYWTSSANPASQFDPEASSDWDCPDVPPFGVCNYPHNFSPVGPFFTAVINKPVTVTLLPVTPIAVSNLTLSDGGKLLLADGSGLRLQNTGAAGVVNSDSTITLSNLLGLVDTDLFIDGQVTLTNGGSLILEGVGNHVGGASAFNLSSTLIVQNHTIEGAGALGDESLSLRVGAGGIVSANRSLEVLEIDPGADNNVVNQGLMRSENGGTLRLKQTAVNNAGGIIEAGSGSLVEFQEVTLFSGTLTGAGVVRGIAPVTLEGPLTNAGTYAIANGTVTQLDGTLTNTGEVVISGGSFLMKTPSVLDGGGTVTLGIPLEGGTSTLGAVFSSGATLDNQSNLIRGGGNISVPLTNRSTVRADEPTAPLRVIGATDNLSTLEADGGAELNVRGPVNNSGGIVVATDGTVLVDGGGSITGGDIFIQGGSFLDFANGSVTGSFVSLLPGATARVLQFETNRLSGTVSVSSGAEIAIDDNASVTFDDSGTYQIGGTLRMDGDGPFASFANTSLQVDGIVSVAGGGEILMSNSSKNVIISDGGDTGTFINNGLRIHGSGQIGRSGIILDNRGTIDANLPPNGSPGSGQITVDPGEAVPMANGGTMRASNGGTLVLRDGDYANSAGTIEAGPGGLVALESAAFIQGGHIRGAGGSVEVRADATFDGATDPLELDAPTWVNTTLGRLRLTGAVTNRDTIRVVGSGQLRIDGPVTLDGGGEIKLVEPASWLTTFQESIPGDLLINLDNRISGRGAIRFLDIQNGGTLAPGNSPGTLYTGNLTQTATGVIEIEVAGTGANEYDVLAVQGTAALGGTLRVIVLPGAAISDGAVIDILTSGGISGGFETVEIGTNPSGQPLFTLSQVGNSLRLTANEAIDTIDYATWTTNEGLDGTNNGADQDPNLDGIPNLVAYYLGIPALGPTQGGGPTIVTDPARGRVLRFSAPISTTAVAAAIELSPDLDGWTPGPEPVALETLDGITEFEAVLPEGDAWFARLSVVENSP